MSCLFRSLGTGVGVGAAELRAQVCDFLSTQPPPVLVDGLGLAELVRAEFPERSLEQYVATMRRPSEFGGAIEIQAFVQMFGINVKVELISGGTIFFTAAPSHQTIVVWWGARPLLLRADRASHNQSHKYALNYQSLPLILLLSFFFSLFYYFSTPTC